MKKIFSLIVIAFAMLVVGCTTSTSRVEWIEFTNVPNAEYVLNSNVTASQFAVTVKISGQEPEVYSLSNSALVVTGLVNGRLDTSTLGEKAVKVTYKGHSVTAYYRVVPKAEWVANDDGYDEFIDSAQELANLAYAVNNGLENEVGRLFKLRADIDLENRLWTPIGTDSYPFKGSFDGQEHKITNLVVTSASGYNNKGLFGVISGKNTEFKNLNLENVNIDATSSKKGEFGKNFGALVGHIKSTVTIKDITVENAYIRGNGRLGAIYGHSPEGVLPTVSNCKVYNSRLSAYNPVTLSGNDGEGDKVGGILGQAQGGVTVQNCSVNNVELVATRDVGGIAGAAHYGLVTLENNIVDANTTISATADGGFLESKVSCNAGGLIGAIFARSQYILNNNSVNTLNIYADENYGSVGNLVGGLRRSAKGTFKVSINNDDVREYEYQEDYSTWSDWLIGQQTILGELGLSE